MVARRGTSATVIVTLDKVLAEGPSRTPASTLSHPQTESETIAATGQPGNRSRRSTGHTGHRSSSHRSVSHRSGPRSTGSPVNQATDRTSDRASSLSRAEPSSGSDRRSESGDSSSLDSASCTPSHSSTSRHRRRHSTSRHSGRGGGRSSHGKRSRHRSSSRHHRRERSPRRSHGHRHRRRTRSRSPSRSRGASGSTSEGSFSGFSRSPPSPPRSYSRKRPHSRGDPRSAKRSRGEQESATLNRMESFMERFTSMLPSTGAGPAIPSQTASPEQVSAEVDPEVMVHQQDAPSSGDAGFAVVADDAHTAKGDSDDDSEAPPSQFLDTISSVYRWLPEKCPKMTLPPPMVRSLLKGQLLHPRTCPAFRFHQLWLSWLIRWNATWWRTGEGRGPTFPRSSWVRRPNITSRTTPRGP